MAKGKHSAALFEVILRGRRSNQPRPGIWESVSSWFRPRPSALGVSAVAGAAPPGGAAAPSAPAAQTGLAVDHDRRQISLNLSYTTAVTCVVAIITLVAVAYLAGQKRGAAPRAALANTTVEEMRRQPPQPGVLDLGGQQRGGGGGAGDVDRPDPSGRGGIAPTTNPSGPLSRTRTNGMNYVIIQSYPEEKMAQDARNVLVQHGIDCTVEKSLPRWSHGNWYSVVGLEPFQRIASPQYDMYVRRIKDVSEKYARRGSFKAFEPKAYSWGKRP